MNIDIGQLIAQLGVSGIAVGALLIVVRTFYQHLDTEIVYLRRRIECLEAEIAQLRSTSFPSK